MATMASCCKHFAWMCREMQCFSSLRTRFPSFLYFFLKVGLTTYVQPTPSICFSALAGQCCKTCASDQVDARISPKKKKNGCLVSPQHRELSDLKILKIIATFKDLGVGYVDLKPLFKKECCLARRMEQRRAGGRRGGGSEPDQSSVCNNRSVEADDRLRQSASQAE